MTTLNGQTPDIAQENIAALRALFPEICCEDKVDFDKLKQVLGDYVDDSKERYNFTWNGKGRALRLAQTPSMGTLRPCPEESKNWDDTENLYLEGDNLEVLKLLQKSYHSKIKMIYIDPPYNTGGDFVYPDDFSDNIENYKKITGQVDSEGKRLGTNAETSGRYHTDWLNMMYPRLRLARNLLTDDGVIFISIDDNEVDNLKKICNEVFGESNFVACIVWQKIHSIKNDAKYFSENHEYAVAYCKSENSVSVGLLARTDEMNDRYKNPDNDLRGPWQSGDLVASGERSNGHFDVISPKTGKVFDVPNGKHWVYAQKNFIDLISDNQIWFGSDGNSFPRKKRFLKDVQEGRTPSTIWLSEEVGHNQTATREVKALFNDVKYFDFPKPVNYIKRFLQLLSAEDSIVLDFFSGSATTAHAVMQLNAEDGGNRKFICVQLPEPCDENSEAAKAGYSNICEIGKERIRRAGAKIESGVLSVESGVEGQVSLEIAPNSTLNTPNSKLDTGFKVFKLDSSNLKKWQPREDNLEQSLFDSVGNYVEGRSEKDVVYEIMLKMGLSLTCPLEEHDVGGKKVYAIGYGALMLCLDDDITTDVAQFMAQLKSQLTPEVWKVVFKDNGFATDSAKVNCKEILKCAGLEEAAFTTV